jgi:hypothetical protein
MPAEFFFQATIRAKDFDSDSPGEESHNSDFGTTGAVGQASIDPVSRQGSGQGYARVS